MNVIPFYGSYIGVGAVGSGDRVPFLCPINWQGHAVRPSHCCNVTKRATVNQGRSVACAIKMVKSLRGSGNIQNPPQSIFDTGSTVTHFGCNQGVTWIPNNVVNKSTHLYCCNHTSLLNQPTGLVIIPSHNLPQKICDYMPTKHDMDVIRRVTSFWLY